MGLSTRKDPPLPEVSSPPPPCRPWRPLAGPASGPERASPRPIEIVTASRPAKNVPVPSIRTAGMLVAAAGGGEA